MLSYIASLTPIWTCLKNQTKPKPSNNNLSVQVLCVYICMHVYVCVSVFHLKKDFIINLSTINKVAHWLAMGSLQVYEKFYNNVYIYPNHSATSQ